MFRSSTSNSVSSITRRSFSWKTDTLNSSSRSLSSNEHGALRCNPKILHLSLTKIVTESTYSWYIVFTTRIRSWSPIKGIHVWCCWRWTMTLWWWCRRRRFSTRSWPFSTSSFGDFLALLDSLPFGWFYNRLLLLVFLQVVMRNGTLSRGLRNCIIHPWRLRTKNWRLQQRISRKPGRSQRVSFLHIDI